MSQTAVEGQPSFLARIQAEVLHLKHNAHMSFEHPRKLLLLILQKARLPTLGHTSYPHIRPSIRSFTHLPIHPFSQPYTHPPINPSIHQLSTASSSSPATCKTHPSQQEPSRHQPPSYPLNLNLTASNLPSPSLGATFRLRYPFVKSCNSTLTFLTSPFCNFSPTP